MTNVIVENKKTKISVEEKAKLRAKRRARFIRNKWLYVLLLPGCLFYILFRYVPMWGVLLAFKDYSPYSGFFGSSWVGFKWFNMFFHSPDFLRILSNTLVLSFLNIVFYFPMPIILSLLLNEIKNAFFKKSVQTLIYIPHFLSWVVISSMVFILFATNDGVVNQMLVHLIGKRIDFLTNPTIFRPMMTIQAIWKDCGYGTIIFLATLAGVDTQLYEAAIVDGAGRFKQLIHVTFPALKSTIVLMLIMRMAGILDNGFDQIFLQTNALNSSVGEVFDTFVYKLGITQGAFSYSTAIGFAKSIASLILILSANFIAKKSGETALF